MVVIAPHRDDETLSIGGLLFSQCQNGTPISLVAVTDGENAYVDSGRLGELRRQEQTLAAECLGIAIKAILRLRITDGEVTQNQRRVVDLLALMVSAETQW
jgi:LmbE family N-acetylglucosaminyl deacetylase